jgi:hypothetical protein
MSGSLDLRKQQHLELPGVFATENWVSQFALGEQK